MIKKVMVKFVNDEVVNDDGLVNYHVSENNLNRYDQQERTVIEGQTSNTEYRPVPELTYTT